MSFCAYFAENSSLYNGTARYSKKNLCWYQSHMPRMPSKQRHAEFITTVSSYFTLCKKMAKKKRFCAFCYLHINTVNIYIMGTGFVPPNKSGKVLTTKRPWYRFRYIDCDIYQIQFHPIWGLFMAFVASLFILIQSSYVVITWQKSISQ